MVIYGTGFLAESIHIVNNKQITMISVNIVPMFGACDCRYYNWK